MKEEQADTLNDFAFIETDDLKPLLKRKQPYIHKFHSHAIDLLKALPAKTLPHEQLSKTVFFCKVQKLPCTKVWSTLKKEGKKNRI